MTDWLLLAACRGLDPELFFATSRYEADTIAALTICRGCPVRDTCLERTLAHEGTIGKDGRWGVAGGLTALQRVRLSGPHCSVQGCPQTGRQIRGLCRAHYEAARIKGLLPAKRRAA